MVGGGVIFGFLDFSFRKKYAMEAGMILCNLTIFCQFCLDKMGSFLYDDVKVLLNGKKIK